MLEVSRVGALKGDAAPWRAWGAVGDFGVAIKVTGLLDQPTLFSWISQEEELSSAMGSLMKTAFFFWMMGRDREFL